MTAPVFTPSDSTPGDDFPVSWPSPQDAQLTWHQDVMHFPAPVTPLTSSLHFPAYNNGTRASIQALSLPIEALRYEAFNGYAYLNALPFVGSPAEVEARLEQMKAAVMTAISDLLDRFNLVYIPRILELADGMRYRDYSGMSLRDLARVVLDIQGTLEELWDIHMRINIPPMAAAVGFGEFLEQAVGPERAKNNHLMLQGFPNKSVEGGQRMYELAALARQHAAVARAIDQRSSNDSLASDLETVPGGQEFLAAWRAYLQEFGWRSGGFELADPGWIEDWSVPLNQLRTYLASPDAEAPIESQRRQAIERDRLVAEFEAEMPAEILPVFRMLLAGAQTYIPLAEDHNYYIDQMAFTSARVPILALGQALVDAGIIASRDDVFFLDMPDIAAIAEGDQGDRRLLVTSRKTDLERARGMVPPEVIGTLPPADAPVDPMMVKFFGVGQDLQSDAKVIRGIASSSGTATGVVKVVRTLDEADKLEPGDIMVVRMTMPAWTPLFATIGAVVADSGGVLSHCSIVAREYGIPAVTGTRSGTRLLRDGQTVTVDGSRGIVRVL